MHAIEIKKHFIERDENIENFVAIKKYYFTVFIPYIIKIFKHKQMRNSHENFLHRIFFRTMLIFWCLTCCKNSSSSSYLRSSSTQPLLIKSEKLTWNLINKRQKNFSFCLWVHYDDELFHAFISLPYFSLSQLNEDGISLCYMNLLSLCWNMLCAQQVIKMKPWGLIKLQI